VKERRFEPEAVLPRASISKSARTRSARGSARVLGTLRAHARLRVLLVEANIGWIPAMLEQTDDMFLRYRWFTETAGKLPTMPSRLFHRNFWATFMVDTVGMELRHRLNVDHLMWSTDYPHTGTDWPNSRVTIDRVFAGVPADQVRRMLHDNCKALYGLDGPGAARR
jgi:predicted TIM-barrel fold metal-dependent hydrolase